MFLTVVYGPSGTSVFSDGVLVRRISVQDFQIPVHVCSGEFVLGDSPRYNNSWKGEFHGLAVYQTNLTSEQVKMNYSSWTNTGQPAESVSGTPGALYLFRENGGNLVQDLGSAGVNLYIPPRYTIARQTLLEPPWRAFEPTLSYVQDVAINIGGFVPLGFALAAYLSARGRANKGMGITVMVGFLLSLTIETLQAYIPTRDSDLTDVLTNTLGTCLGVVLYRDWLPAPLRIFSWMRT